MATDHVLHLGECVEGMSLIGGKGVDVVIADPPYSAKVHADGRRVSVHADDQETHGATKRKQIDYRPMTDAARVLAAAEITRIAKRWSLVFCDVESVSLWIAALEANGQARYVRTCAWIKPDGQPCYSGDRPAAGFEAIVVAHRKGGRMHWNGGGRRGIFTANTREAAVGGTNHMSGRRGEVKLRDGQKPVELMLDLVQLFSDPGELVADPYTGAATTAIACMRTGRRFVGWEEHEPTYKLALERMEAEAVHSTMAERRRGQRAIGDLLPPEPPF